jgi:PAS domain S-box-containing protein
MTEASRDAERQHMCESVLPKAKVNILVVDDQPENLLAMGAVLAPLGETVYTAASGKQALELVLNHDFATILLDIKMPVMDGFETARLIRDRDRSRDTPILFVSAMNAEPEAILAGYRLGAVDFAFEPFDGDVIRSKASGSIELHRMRMREQAHERDLRGLVINNADGMLILNSAGAIRFTNPAAQELLGRTAEQLLGVPFGYPINSNVATEVELRSAHAGLRVAEMRVVTAMWEGKQAWVVSLRDVSARKQAERRDRLARDVFTLLNEPQNNSQLVHGIVQMVKESLGMEAVGIRLREGDDFPYCETNGFPGHFVQTENHLCARDASGESVRDTQGIAVLECMCGNVLRGRTDPKHPFFTEGGSFWTNSTSKLLATETEGCPLVHTRNRCNREGYESVALIPLRSGETTYGLLQLNDHRRDQFNLEIIQYLEWLCASIGIGLARNQAELELRASEEKFRSIFNNVSDGIALTNAVTGKFTLVNDAFCEMLGYPFGEIVELTVEAIHSQETLAVVLGQAPTKADGTPRLAADVPIRRKDGRIFYADIYGVVVEIAGKKYALGCYRDVTDKRELQTHLAQSDRLSTMGTLAAGVAHEINNPLSYVLYNVQSLGDDLRDIGEAMRRCHAALCAEIGPASVKELLGALQEFISPALFDDIAERLKDTISGTMRIKAITRALGTFSRVERTEVAPVDVHQAAEHAINMAFNEIKYRARLVKDFGTVPMVLASDGKLAQVFLNLLINAAHAIGDGHVEHNEIRIRTWSDGAHVFAEVRDTGKGIAPEHQGRLFEPFFTTKRVGVGTGLGLSICKTIIANFGGEITFTSELEKGTCFLIRLPCMPSTWAKGCDDVQEPARVVPQLRGRILVVDDEEGIRACTERLLSRDHEVVTAASGEAAQKLLEGDRRFDLVLCDLMMPKMSGMELHAWLAQCDPGLAERVVFVSGGAFTPGASDYLKAVGNLRLEKPFDADNMRNLVSKLVISAKVGGAVEGGKPTGAR